MRASKSLFYARTGQKNPFELHQRLLKAMRNHEEPFKWWWKNIGVTYRTLRNFINDPESISPESFIRIKKFLDTNNY